MALPLTDADTFVSLYAPETSLDNVDDAAAIAALLISIELEFGRVLGFGRLGTTVESGSVVMYLDGSGEELLDLPANPVTAIASVYEDIERTYDADTLVSSDDYELCNEGNRYYLLTKPTGSRAMWLTGTRSIKVTATIGYSAATWESSGLAYIVMELAGRRFKNPNAQGIDQLNAGNVSLTLKKETFSAGLPPDILAKLGQYCGQF